MEFMMTVDIHRPTRGLSPDGGFGSTLSPDILKKLIAISAETIFRFSKEFCDVFQTFRRG